jgi:hypothetical protein
MKQKNGFRKLRPPFINSLVYGMAGEINHLPLILFNNKLTIDKLIEEYGFQNIILPNCTEQKIKII